MKLQVVCGADAPPVQRQTHPAALRVMRIEVDNRYNDLGAVEVRFGISDDLFVVGVDEFKRMIELQRRMRPPRLIKALDQLAHRARLGRVPMPDLVFLRIEVLLAAVFAWTVLAQ